MRSKIIILLIVLTWFEYGCEASPNAGYGGDYRTEAMGMALINASQQLRNNAAIQQQQHQKQVEMYEQQRMQRQMMQQQQWQHQQQMNQMQNLFGR